MAFIIESTENYFSINGAVFPINSCSVTKISDGIRISFIAYSQSMDISWEVATLNGIGSISVDDLYDWFKVNCFSLTGGGDGTGSQLPLDFFTNEGTINPTYIASNSTQNSTVLPLDETELNALYGTMAARFLVFCDNAGSGMTYYKVTGDSDSEWYNWPTSRAINQQ